MGKNYESIEMIAKVKTKNLYLYYLFGQEDNEPLFLQDDMNEYIEDNIEQWGDNIELIRSFQADIRQILASGVDKIQVVYIN